MKLAIWIAFVSVVSSEGDAARAPKLTINYTVPSSQTSGITNDGYYFIRNRSTGKYLTLSDDSMNVELTDYTGTSNQLWQTQYNGNGSYMLVPRADTTSFMNIELNKDSFVNFSKDRAVDTICHELGHSLGLGDLYIDSSYGYTYTLAGSTEEKPLDNSDHLMFGFGNTRNLNGLGNVRFHSNDLFGVNMVQGWLDLEKYTKEQLYSDADFIVRGRVTGTQNYSENEIRGDGYTQVIFEVDEYLYSKANSTEKLLTFLQLGMPGTEFAVDPLYKIDEEYVLFLHYDL